MIESYMKNISYKGVVNMLVLYVNTKSEGVQFYNDIFFNFFRCKLPQLLGL